jgi:hypothetical protein
MVMAFMPNLICGQVQDCSERYETALLLYNGGMADSALIILKPCIDNKRELQTMSKVQRARIFRLAALSGIMTGKPDNAEKYAREMLINQPDYRNKENEDDLVEFRLILEKLKPQPSFRFGIAGGSSLAFLKLRKEYSNYDLKSPEYSVNAKMGYHLGVKAEKTISKNLSIEAAVSLEQARWNYAITDTNVQSNINILNTYPQKIIFAEIPVLAKYYFKMYSFRPYLEAGISARM